MKGAARVWLHIGAPKSGTSALQRYLNDNAEAVARDGLTYVTPKGKKSANDLAVAINRGRDSLGPLGADLSAGIEGAGTGQAIISSEMFYGVAPDAILGAVPALAGRDLRVVVYLRRQDRYLESKYIQKSKNGRFKGDMNRYLKKFGGSGADYADELAAWEATPGVTVVPRICEPARLTGGSTVSDMLALAGLPAPDPEAAAAARENASPSAVRLELMRLMAEAGGFDVKKIQRNLASAHPPAPGAKARIFGRAERLAVLDRYAPGNETLRARYFPDQAHLFDMSDLDDAPEAPDAAFTEEQRTEIRLLLETIAARMGEGG